MTVSEFRSNPVFVGRMRELLLDNVFANAIVAIQDEMPVQDAGDSADALVSVRLLSRQFQHKATIATLLSLAEPMPPPGEEEVATFGIDPNQFITQPAE